MPNVNSAPVQSTCNSTCASDKTPPPRPTINQSIAFDKAKDDATVFGGRTNTRSAGRRDPAYIELGNVEVGTTFEIINLSANPNAEFKGKDVLRMAPTGRDTGSRTASIYMKQSQMEKMGIKPGDMYAIRAVDAHGNASEHAVGEFEPNDWASMRVQETTRGRSTIVDGNRFSMLDGEAQRKNVIAKSVNDARAPLILDKNITLARSNAGAIKVQFDKAIEPRSRVRVTNQRTGEVKELTMPDNREAELKLKAQSGDPLVVDVWDNENNQGRSVDLVYSPKCKDGKAPKLTGGLSARLPGVI